MTNAANKITAPEGIEPARTLLVTSFDSGVHAKIVSDRIGHAHEGITVAIYGHRSTGHDRDAAELVAGLIRRHL